MKHVLFVILFLFSPVAYALNTNYLGGKVDIKDPSSMVRAPNTGISLNTMRYNGTKIGYLETTFGRYFPLVTLIHNNFSTQLSLKAGAWISLGYKDGAFPLLTEDFLLAIPWSFKLESGRRIWETYISFNHISAHLGDGFNGMIEDGASIETKRKMEFYRRYAEKEGQDVEILLKAPFSYSRDFMSLYLACNIKMSNYNVKYYVTAGYAHKMIPSYLNKGYGGVGGELSYKHNNFKPYTNIDLRINGDTESLDLSTQLGVYFKGSYGYQFRTYLGGYYGSDRRGQLLGKHSNILNVGLAIE